MPPRKKAAKKVEEDEKEVDEPSPGNGSPGSTGAGKRKAKLDKESSGVDSETVEKKGKRGAANKSDSVEKKNEIEEDSYDCVIDNKNGEKWNLKISSWNVAGMRAWIKKNGIDYVIKENPDVICFQETKCPESKVPAEVKLEGYHTYWASGTKDGYAGVALYSKEKPLKVTYGIGSSEYDAEGRLITAEYEQFYVLCVYVPNAGQGLKTLPKRMEWDNLFRNYLKELDNKKPLILCGDMNVAHQEIDLANPKTNKKNAGFTPEERENMSLLIKEGFVDTYRELYPDKTGAYTFWSYLGNARSRNTGWRLDYFIVSERIKDSVCDVVIRNKVLGSDHCPVTMFIRL